MKLPKHSCGLYIEHNSHKDLYIPIEDAVRDCTCDWISEEDKQTVLDTDNLWTVQWYPDTPIGFYSVAGSSIDKVLDHIQKKYED